jgi:hypothetical protein
MRVTLQFDGKSISVNAQSGFELLVDGETLLSHGGESCGGQVPPGYETVKPLYAQEKTCCGGKCCDKDAGYADVGYGQETLFPKQQEAADRIEKLMAQIQNESSEINHEDTRPEKIVHHSRQVPNSSFISQIRWWNWEETFGENVLEVSLKDGRIWYYTDVPFHVYAIWVKTIIDGGSAGRYFNKSIKDTYELVRELTPEEYEVDGDDE